VEEGVISKQEECLDQITIEECKRAVHIKCIHGILECVTVTDPRLKVFVSDRDEDVFTPSISPRMQVPFSYEILAESEMAKELQEIKEEYQKNAGQ
jgi:hypothetical protein